MVGPARKPLSASDHPDKEIQRALKEILDRTSPSFTLYAGGHWGILRCSNGCCQISVSGTPRVPARDARKLIREADRCPLDEHDVRNHRR
jgi:hypothetical protein